MTAPVWKTIIVSISVVLAGCGGEKTDNNTTSNQDKVQQNETGLTDFELEHGIGPVTQTLTISETIDPELVEKGRLIFEMKCEACHNMEGRMVGPALGEVVERRSPEFIMNMILNPGEMTKKHPVAKELLQEYMSIMPFQNIEKEEARAIVEYFRDYNKEN